MSDSTHDAGELRARWSWRAGAAPLVALAAWASLRPHVIVAAGHAWSRACVAAVLLLFLGIALYVSRVAAEVARERTAVRCWRPALTGMIAWLVFGACSDSVRPLGERWVLARPERLPEAGFARERLLRVGRLATTQVDDRVDIARFYPPDCVLYQQGGTLLIFAACGDHRPVVVASDSYRMEEGGLRDADSTSGDEGADAGGRFLPIARIREVATARTSGRSAKGDDDLDVRAEIAPSGTGSDWWTNPHARDSNGTTSLMWAARDTRPDRAEKLLRAGADPNVADDKGNTALLVATMRPNDQDSAVVRLLLAGGANPNARNTFGDTPLRLARRHNSPLVATLLLQRGAYYEEP